MEGDLLYPRATNLPVNVIQKNTFAETSKIMFDQISGNCDPAKLTHKINHHIMYCEELLTFLLLFIYL